jgi:hypothetical protein
METPEAAQTITDLDAWDWRAEARRQGHTLEWLARETDYSLNTVYSYSRGRQLPSAGWLIRAARALGIRVVLDA